MLETIEYDDKKLAQDSSLIQEIIKDIQKDVNKIFIEESGKRDIVGIRDIMSKQDIIMTDLENQYDRLIDICHEIGAITACIEKTRQKYRKCEDKISELLDKVRLVENV